MSHLVDPQTPLAGFRRHTDPPNLWLNVLAASILLHAIALWILRPALVQVSFQPSGTPVPVSVIEVAPSPPPAASVRNGAATSPRTGRRGQIAPSRIASARSGVPRPATAIASTQQLQVLRKPPKSRRLLPKLLKRSPKPAPLKPDTAPTPLSRPPVLPSQSSESPIPSVPPATPPLPSTPPPPLQPRGVGPTPFPPTPPLPSTPPESSGSPTSVPPATPPLPSLPASPSPPVETLPPLPVPSNGPVEAQLVGNPQPGLRDLHKHLAQPERNTKPVNSLIYLQRIQQRGKPVEFEVMLTVDTDGRAEVRRVTPVSGQASSDLNDFAEDLFKDWKFRPAYDNDPKVPVVSDLIVRVRVNSL